MLLKSIIFILSLFLAISLTANFILVKKQNVYISFNNPISPTPLLTQTPSTPTPTAYQGFLKKGEIGKLFNIPIRDSQGNTITELQYTLTDYEITQEIIIKGQKANAIKGRAFLIVNIKIENPHENVIEVDTRDYIRLSIDSGNWLSPDIHNDPIEIQPQSNKYTRLGFPINESDTNFSLQIGEPKGQKELITL